MEGIGDANVMLKVVESGWKGVTIVHAGKTMTGRGAEWLWRSRVQEKVRITWYMQVRCLGRRRSRGWLLWWLKLKEEVLQLYGTRKCIFNFSSGGREVVRRGKLWFFLTWSVLHLQILLSIIILKFVTLDDEMGHCVFETDLCGGNINVWGCYEVENISSSIWTVYLVN